MTTPHKIKVLIVQAGNRPHLDYANLSRLTNEKQLTFLQDYPDKYNKTEFEEAMTTSDLVVRAYQQDKKA